jgi:hypothetical protein
MVALVGPASDITNVTSPAVQQMVSQLLVFVTAVGTQAHYIGVSVIPLVRQSYLQEGLHVGGVTVGGLAGS